MKLAILASGITAFYWLRPYHVPPFGGLGGNRTQAHLKDPIFHEWRDLLDEKKARYLLLVTCGWILILIALGILGLVFPSRLTKVIESAEHIFVLLNHWPLIQQLADWVVTGFCTALIGLYGAVFVYSLTFHVLALKAGPE